MCDGNITLKRFKALVDKEKSRDVIAKAIKCNTSTITKHYNGDRTISTEYIIKYSKYFNVSADYLLGLSDVDTTDKDIQYICDYTGLSIEAIEKLHTKLDDSIMNEVIDVDKLCEIAAKMIDKEKSEVYNTLFKNDVDIKSTIMNYSAIYLRYIEDNKTYLRYLNELIKEDLTMMNVITTLNNYISKDTLTKKGNDDAMKMINRNIEYYNLLTITLSLKDFAEKLRGAENGND